MKKLLLLGGRGLGLFALGLLAGISTITAGPALAANSANLGTPATPVTVTSRLRVRIVTGAQELSAGSVLELRIYEAGKPVRRLVLTHGESWPRDSTRTISLNLGEPLDTRAVSRFSLYYRPASPLTPPWEVAAADVEIGNGVVATPGVATPGAPAQRLLNATLSGVVNGQGELASDERDAKSMACVSDSDCDDHRTCNGHERCAPRTAGADARGCVKGLPVVCPVNEVCSEQRGCLGPEAIAPK